MHLVLYSKAEKSTDQRRPRDDPISIKGNVAAMLIIHSQIPHSHCSIASWRRSELHPQKFSHIFPSGDRIQAIEDDDAATLFALSL